DPFLIFITVFYILIFEAIEKNSNTSAEQCQTLNGLVLPEYGIHIFFNLLFLFSGEWVPLLVNMPLIVYHINR
ncbi:unnamed protein product, partial [Darwinula stevensoni]